MMKLEIIPVKRILLTVIAVVFGILSVRGQCVVQSRTYANFQGTYLEGLGALGSPTILGYTNNPTFAINGDVKQSSTLGIQAGLLGLATVTQFLEFTTTATHATKRTLNANTPVRLKFTIPTEVLGVLSGIEVGSFTNLNPISASWPTAVGIGHSAGYNSTNTNAIYTGATLLALVNGSGDFEITVSPSIAFEGVYIRLKGNGLSVNLKADVYHAYILENSGVAGDCNSAIDVLAGIRAGNLANLATATGEVLSKWDAIDADELNTYAELKLGAQVASEVFHTTVFKTLAQPGDAVQMIIQKPGGGLLDLNLLNGFTIRMFNGQAQVGTVFSASSGLSLSLLPGSTTGNEKYLLTIPVPKAAGAFDRVELKIGGLLTAGLTPGIRIYDVKHIVLPKTAINGTNASSINLCFGNSATLSVSEFQDCTTYKWFNTPTGGTALYSVNGSYTPTVSSLVIGQNIFYLEATRTNCTDIINRVPVTININPLPTALISGTASVCQSAPTPSVIFTGANGTGPYTFTYTINAGTNQTISTTTGNSTSLLVPNAIPGEYKYLLVNVKDNGGNQCLQAQSSLVTVTVTAKPQPPSLIINANN
jgi:hypothetical protein